MRNFGIKKIAVILAYLILLCLVTAGSIKFMSNVKDAAKQVKNFATEAKNATTGIVKGFKKCLFCGCSHGEEMIRLKKTQPVDPPNKYPWMVQMYFGGKSPSSCSGAILDGYHILTAAHCLFRIKACIRPQENFRFTPKEIQIILLTSNSTRLRIGPPVAETFVHPQYELRKPDYNDIGVVKLKNPITCNKFASPICLPSPDFKVPDFLNVAGWESSEFRTEGKIPILPPLLESNVKIQPPIRCGSLDPNETDYHCVMGIADKAPCFGDSGGPMFLKKKVYYTLGVASRQLSLISDPSTHAMYTDVPRFMEYIQNITGLKSAYKVEVKVEVQSKK